MLGGGDDWQECEAERQELGQEVGRQATDRGVQTEKTMDHTWQTKHW